MPTTDRPELSYISSTLKGAAAQMTNRERGLALECYEHWRSECQRLASEPPESVAHTLHCVIDERIEHMLQTSRHGPDVQCRKGCAACCSLQVDISAREAELLLHIVREQGIAIDRARLERQAAKTSVDTWRELPPEDRACVFLGDDRACRVYEHRPGACRKYMVKSDPALCDSDKHPGHEVAIVFDVEAEIVHSAGMTVYGAGSMAEMLLRAAPPP